MARGPSGFVGEPPSTKAGRSGCRLSISGRRRPFRPQRLAVDVGAAEPLEAFAADADAVADGGLVLDDQVEEVVARIDDDRARRLARLILDDLLVPLLVDLGEVGQPVGDAVVDGGSGEKRGSGGGGLGRPKRPRPTASSARPPSTTSLRFSSMRHPSTAKSAEQPTIEQYPLAIQYNNDIFPATWRDRRPAMQARQH